MNIEGIPVYQLDASAIQALLTQSTTASVGDTHGSVQESNTDKVSTDFKVSEGENKRMKKCAD